MAGPVVQAVWEGATVEGSSRGSSTGRSRDRKHGDSSEKARQLLDTDLLTDRDDEVFYMR